MSTSWDEIRQLAADFQKTQLIETSQKLTERNCIEIVNKLIKKNLLEIIFTTDGKEYITPSQLLFEIENELHANNGRIYLNDLSNILQVDISLIEQKSLELVKNSKGKIVLILSQLISSEYKDQLANEINIKLQTKGSITIAEIVKFCDLPPEFILNLVLSKLKKIIDGVQDPNDYQTFFTSAYLEQYKSKITGVLNGVTKPTQINQIISYYKIPQKIFNSVIHDLLKKKVEGSITSNINGVFIPNVYFKFQNDWIENFLKNNKYLEFDVLNKIKITDPKSYFKKRDVIFLKTCLIEKFYFDRICLGIEGVAQENNWIDLYTLVPSVLNNDDFSKIFEEFIKKNKKYSENLILFNNYVISKKLILKLSELFNFDIKEKASDDLRNNLLSSFFNEKQNKDNLKSIDPMVSNKKKDERKLTTLKQKSGGGVQGREVKMKSTKKKYITKKDTFSDDEYDDGNKNINNNLSNTIDLKYLNSQQIKKLLIKKSELLNEASDDLLDEISERLQPILDNMYLNTSKKMFFEQQTLSSFEQRKTHVQVQNSTISIYSNIFVFNKGLSCLPDGELKNNMAKYLCKSLCNELINNLIIYCLEEEANLNLNTFDARTKVIKRLDEQYREDFNKLNLLLSQNSIEKFLDQVIQIANKLDIKIRKIDKRRENAILLENKHNLLNQLYEAKPDDFALILHLSILIIFNEINKQMIFASGKFVPQIINQLKAKIDEQTFDLLIKCEKLVVTLFKKDTNDEEKQNAITDLNKYINDVKSIATTLPKNIFKNNESKQ